MAESRAREIAAGLLGAWTVVRRASVGDVRFERVTFYRDGRFGTRAVDHRTMVYGNWWLERGPVGASERRDEIEAPEMLWLRFDHSTSPSASFHLHFEIPLAGPCTLVDSTSGATRLVLERALPIEAALVGEWRSPTGTLEHGNTGMAGLDLLRDGRYLLYPAGGGPRSGRWAFARESASVRGPITGALVLDPRETFYRCERWSAEVSLRGTPCLTLRPSPGARAIELRRRELPMPEAALLGPWRLLPPGGPGAPDEVQFFRGGRLETLPHPGVARTHGQWSLSRTDPQITALRGVLSLSAFVATAGVPRQRWNIHLAFARSTELVLESDDGRHTLHYRRLFR